MKKFILALMLLLSASQAKACDAVAFARGFGGTVAVQSQPTFFVRANDFFRSNVVVLNQRRDVVVLNQRPNVVRVRTGFFGFRSVVVSR